MTSGLFDFLRQAYWKCVQWNQKVRYQNWVSSSGTLLTEFFKNLAIRTHSLFLNLNNGRTAPNIALQSQKSMSLNIHSFEKCLK